jgi:hypothetical protein
VIDYNYYFFFQNKQGEPTNERVSRCAQEVLSRGPMSNKLQHDYYKQFISCGDDSVDLSGIHTSCGIFVRAVLYYCGCKVNPAKNNKTLLEGWVPFGFSHPSWTKYRTPDTTQPAPGAIFFVQSKASPDNCHVGIFVEDMGNNTWTTAEGGKNDGTECSMGKRTLGPMFDNGRNLIGFFDTNMINLPVF